MRWASKMELVINAATLMSPVDCQSKNRILIKTCEERNVHTIKGGLLRLKILDFLLMLDLLLYSLHFY